MNATKESRSGRAPAADSGARLIKAVQTCRRKVAGLGDDDAWRDFLVRETGKRSLREMNNRELGKVLDALRAKGAPKAPPRRAGARHLPESRLAMKVRALWLSLYHLGAISDPSEAALNGFCKRQVGVDTVAWLAPETAFKLIEALKARCKRAGFDLSAEPSLQQLNDRRLSMSMPPVDEGWRAKALLVRALAAKLELEPDETYGLWSRTAAEMDDQIEQLGARVRAAKPERA